MQRNSPITFRTNKLAKIRRVTCVETNHRFKFCISLSLRHQRNIGHLGPLKARSANLIAKINNPRPASKIPSERKLNWHLPAAFFKNTDIGISKSIDRLLGISYYTE